ncbi:VOC family protein [Microbacteriaceae bacterium VKM Ac-2855]|nr:VOC family protein [Microbacteriaceae bacterium VKM Ac-2855]
MPETPPIPVGAPVWFDLATSDIDESTRFYEGVFGWLAIEGPAEFGGYVNFEKNGVQVAGMMANPGQGAPDGWTVYLKSADASATAEAIADAGGTVLVPADDVAELGTMAIAVDPDGGAVGVWQPKTMQGYGLFGEDGAPGWFELHTRDFANEMTFYRDAFGWSTDLMSDSDEFRYGRLMVDGQPYAGVMDGTNFLPEGAPAAWEVYIVVTDTDATVAAALDLGGSILIPPEDSPFGRLAKIADPTGGSIKVVQMQ